MSFKKGHTFYPGSEKGWFKKDIIPWNKKGLKKNCLFCNKEFETKPSHFERRKCCSIVCFQQYRKAGSKLLNKKDKACLDCGALIMRSSIRCRRCANLGAKSPFYIHGKAKEYWSEREIIKATSKYKQWRMAVFMRDNWTCQNCGNKGGKLQANHIKSFAYYPSSRFDINNGETLCIACHKKTPNYGYKARLMEGGDVHEFQS